ncbi:MAG TPA: hypothetical protein VJH37_01380 [Candidatus Nanoarchaeia archaeon]|nr:hypothetical protein [Candidatus Nanoarchaeia archaeon]
MALTPPASMDDCVYFTNRTLGDSRIKAWVLRKQCPKCKNGLMQKPRDPKTGKYKLRAKDYQCPSCKYQAPIEEYECTLTMSILYTCPKCKKSNEIQVPFKRKKAKMFDEVNGKYVTVDAVQFNCQSCQQKMFVTKKMR